MKKPDILTLLRYSEGSLSAEQLPWVETWLQAHPEDLAEVLEWQRLDGVMSAGKAQALPGTAWLSLQVTSGDIAGFDCRGGDARLVPALEVRGDARPLRNEPEKLKLEFQLHHPEARVEVLCARGNAYWIVLSSPHLKGHTVKLRRKGEDYPLYIRRAGADSLTIKGLSEDSYELLFLEECVDIDIRES